MASNTSFTSFDSLTERMKEALKADRQLQPDVASSVEATVTVAGRNGSVASANADVFKYDQQNKKQPIYDWGNDEYTAVARGRKIVIGIISLPIAGHGYLESVLLSKLNPSPSLDPAMPAADAFALPTTANQSATDVLDLVGGGYKITITIKNPHEGVKMRTHKTISDVEFTSRSLTIDANTGAPLAEVYSFFGKMAPGVDVTT